MAFLSSFSVAKLDTSVAPGAEERSLRRLDLCLDMAGLMAGTLNAKTVVIEPEMLDIIAELDEFKSACAR